MDVVAITRNGGNSRPINRSTIEDKLHVDQLAAQAKWRCGRIVCENGQLTSIRRRWWPYLGNIVQAMLDTKLRPLKKDRCELFYHQPWSSPNYLSLAYVRSGPGTSLSTFYLATLALDHIARLKRSDGIVCHVSNDRISDKLLARWGWQQHCLDWPGRHFIKRFYGDYPDLGDCWSERLHLNTIGKEAIVTVKRITVE